MLNKLYHVQITFSHSRVLTMEQQTPCNHTVQNIETNSNYLFESMSHISFLSSVSSGNNNSDFQLHSTTVSYFLVCFQQCSHPYRSGMMEVSLKSQLLIKRHGSPRDLRPSELPIRPLQLKPLENIETSSNILSERGWIDNASKRVPARDDYYFAVSWQAKAVNFNLLSKALHALMVVWVIYCSLSCVCWHAG